MNNDPPTNIGARKLRKLFLWIIAIGFLLTVSLVTFIVGTYVWIFYQAGKEADFVLKVADEGFKKAKATIDPEKLRAWALEEISKRNTNTNFFMSNSEIPANIVNLYSDSPEDVSVNKYNDPNQSYVEICWGGGFFHWMIDIGSTNYIETTGATNTYTTVEWVPGIYYSREDTRHPFK
jgi:hypothetical protein